MLRLSWRPQKVRQEPKNLAGQTADDSLPGHGHGDDGPVGILLFHDGGRFQQGQDILGRFGHDRNLGNISAQILHLAQPVNDIVFGRGFIKVMIGANHLDAIGVSRAYDAGNGFSADEDFHINEIDQAAGRNGAVDPQIVFRRDRAGTRLHWQS